MDFRSLYRLNLLFINAGGKVKYLLRLSSLSKTKKLLKTNEEIIATRKHDTIYICGLGPSLADVDLDRLIDKDTDTLVVNHFFKMAEKTKLRPTYYLMADAGFMKPKHIEAFNKAVEMYKKDTTFVWSTSFLSINPDLVNLDCKKTFLAMYNGYYIDPKKFELTKVMPAFGNVVCAAIAFAIGAGYKKIVLLGCDFNSFPSLIRFIAMMAVRKTRLYEEYLLAMSSSAIVSMHLSMCSWQNMLEHWALRSSILPKDR